MDTDSLPSAIVLGTFLLLFSCLSFFRRTEESHLHLADQSATSEWLKTAIPWLKYGCVIAAAVSGLALINSISTIRWWPSSFLALALLVALLLIDRAAGRIAAGELDWALRVIPGFGRKSTGSADVSEPGSISGGVDDGDQNGSRTGGSDELLPERPTPEITHEELHSLDQRDREMLRSILRLDVTTAREIMVPRLDMVTVEGDATLREVSEMMAHGGHSRLPVYEETVDQILGVVHVRDVLATFSAGNAETKVRDLVRPAFLIPETKRLDELLEELQDRGAQMAVVVDEYGGTEGLVTMEDVLEEIVGEIEDEFSRAGESRVVRLSERSVLVDAGITTENVEELFGTQIETTDVDTVGGLVYHNLGRIPQIGDVVVTDHLRIEVVSTLGRRLRRLRIDRVDDGDLEESG